jgi:hypothetical protein
MRQNPPVVVSPIAGHSLCLLNKHQLIDLLAWATGKSAGLSDADTISRIEGLAMIVLPKRGDRVPAMRRHFDECTAAHSTQIELQGSKAKAVNDAVERPRYEKPRSLSVFKPEIA